MAKEYTIITTADPVVCKRCGNQINGAGSYSCVFVTGDGTYHIGCAPTPNGSFEWTPEMKSAAMADARRVCELTE